MIPTRLSKTMIHGGWYSLDVHREPLHILLQIMLPLKKLYLYSYMYKCFKLWCVMVLECVLFALSESLYYLHSETI
jgi:hypothetical protein